MTYTESCYRTGNLRSALPIDATSDVHLMIPPLDRTSLRNVCLNHKQLSFLACFDFGTDQLGPLFPVSAHTYRSPVISLYY